MDRDLLFGVIAVQLGQATPQQVMIAASAYVVDKSKGLPERLLADGVLDQEHFGMLERMVNEALEVHGGDVHQTMQSIGGERVLFASFGGSLVQDEKGKITVLPEGERERTGDSVSDSVEDAEAVTPETDGRYRKTGEEIGRGGIGRVLIAFDEHLGREIAVKELLADTTGSMPKSARSDELLISGADDWKARIRSVATKQTVLVIKTPSACMATPFSPDGKHVVLDWGHAVRFFPIDLSIRDADPQQLLATAEREAGLKLEGVTLVPAE